MERAGSAGGGGRIPTWLQRKAQDMPEGVEDVDGTPDD
ncbi:MAG: hypothetical protein ACI9QL_002840, partial [Candidatus Omnitrophota bacterium]